MRFRDSRTRGYRAIAAIGLALLLVATACGDDDDDAAPDVGADDGGDTDAGTGDDRIVIAVSAEPVDLDPYGVAQNEAVTQFYEQLYQFDSDGELVPTLATDLPTEVEPGVYDVPIREGVVFHDGTELTAEVAAEALNLLYSLEGNVDAATRLRDFWDNAAAEDDFTLRITLNGPVPNIARELAQMPIAQPGDRDPAAPVGTGPYEFVRWDRGRSLVGTRFDDYWGEAPEVSEFEYRFIPELATQISAFRAGEVDVIHGEALPVQGISESNIEIVDHALSRFLVPNMLDGATADVRVRQALNYAIDREALNEALFDGDATILPCQPMSEQFVGFNPDLEAYPFDPDRARELIAEAGAEGASISAITPEGRWPGDRELVEAITAMWSDVGLDASPQVLGVAEDFINAIIAPDPRPDAFLTSRDTQVADGSNMVPYFAPPGSTAPASVTAEIAERFGEINEIIDEEDRDAAWQDFYADACEEAWFVYLVAPPYRWVHSDAIESVNAAAIVAPEFSRVADIDLAD